MQRITYGYKSVNYILTSVRPNGKEKSPVPIYLFLSSFANDYQKVDLHDDKKKNNNNKDCKRDYGGTPLIRPPTGHENLFKL